MAFNVGEIVAYIKADVSDFNAGIKSIKSGVTDVGEKITDFGKKVSIVSAVVAVPFVSFLKSASNEAVNLERALTTLDIIAGRFGVSGEKAKEAAQALGTELRIGVGSAAAGIQNLLKSGLNLEQATDLMKRFTNEAITGKSSSITLAQAVENLSFAYATNNSAIGNLSGINENFINIIDKGKQALIDEGVAADTITEEMAKYRGMIDLTNLTMGSSERFHGTLIDKQAEMSQKLIELKVAFGQLINPILFELVNALTGAFNWLNSLNESQKMMILGIGAFIVAVGPAITIIGMLTTAFSVLIGVVTTLGTVIAFVAANPLVWIVVAIAAVVAAGIWLVKHWDEVKEAASNLGAWVVSKWETMKEKLSQVGHKILDAIMWPFEEAKKRIQDAVNFIKDRLDFTQRHSPSVLDIVQRGVHLVNNALSELPTDINIGTNVALAGATAAGTTNQMAVTVDMAGAVIGDMSQASLLGEMIGDNIIKRLKLNVRF